MYVFSVERVGGMLIFRGGGIGNRVCVGTICLDEHRSMCIKQALSPGASIGPLARGPFPSPQ